MIDAPGIAFQILQSVFVVLAAPLLMGWANQCRAWLQNRSAPSILLPYYTLAKLFHKDAVDGLRQKLVAFLVEKTQITPQEWKELVGSTRKFAIPLAEHFDAEKLTLRIGDLRKLRSKPVV